MSSRPLRVLVLGDARSFHIERFVGEWQRQGCEILLASVENGTIPHERIGSRIKGLGIGYFLAESDVRKLAKAWKPDLINAHFVSGYGFVAARANQTLKLPLCLHAWGSDILVVPRKSFLHRKKTAYAIKQASHVIADSQFLLDETIAIGGKTAGSVIAWGIEREACLSQGEVTDQLHTPLRLFMPRSHESVYQTEFVIDGLASLLKAQRATLTVPDWGSKIESFRAKASELPSDSIRYYSRLPRDKYLELARQHDCYLSAALSDSSPASLIEAMGLGLVPIVARIPGVEEWGRSGGVVYFQTEQRESLVESVQAVMQRKVDIAKVRATNLDQVSKKGIFEENIAETIAVFSRLVKK